MDLRDPGKNCLRIRSAIRIVLSVGLAASVILTGCSHDSGSRIHVELRDPPESKSAGQTDSTNKYSCPDADHGDTDGQTDSSGGHSVKLSWNLSTSSTGPNDEKILYCIYRTRDGAVQQKKQGSNYPCANCQRVTKIAVKGTTTDPDRNVENGARYCYVAVAIDVSNGKVSGFSNQAPAVIPPGAGPFSCDAQTNDKQRDRKNSRGHR